MADEKPTWDMRGLVIAVAQLVVGGAMLITAAVVPSASGLHEVGMLLVGSCVGGAVLPGVRR